jgi:hypothetical protein
MRPRDAARANLRTLGLVAGYAALFAGACLVVMGVGYVFIWYVFGPLYLWMEDHVGEQGMAATIAVLVGTGWLLSTLARPWIEVLKREDSDE